MATFDLSLAAPVQAEGDVKASKDYPVHKDPETGEKTLEKTTDGGITIDKSKAPAIKLDGPMGHYYTELLNKELSMESMSAIAAMTSMDEQIESEESSGKITVDSQGAHIEDTGSEGYIYIVNADTLEAKDLRTISDNFLKKRLEDHKRQLGIAMVSEGNPSPTLESLTNILQSVDVKITYSRQGVVNMAKEMIQKGQ